VERPGTLSGERMRTIEFGTELLAAPRIINITFVYNVCIGERGKIFGWS